MHVSNTKQLQKKKKRSKKNTTTFIVKKKKFSLRQLLLLQLNCILKERFAQQSPYHSYSTLENAKCYLRKHFAKKKNKKTSDTPLKRYIFDDSTSRVLGK